MSIQHLDLHLALKVSDMKYVKRSVNRLPRNLYTLNKKRLDKICNVLSITFCTYNYYSSRLTICTCRTVIPEHCGNNFCATLFQVYILYTD